MISVNDRFCDGFAQCDLIVALALRNTTALPDQEHEFIHEGRNRRRFGKERSILGGVGPHFRRSRFHPLAPFHAFSPAADCRRLLPAISQVWVVENFVDIVWVGVEDLIEV